MLVTLLNHTFFSVPKDRGICLSSLSIIPLYCSLQHWVWGSLCFSLSLTVLFLSFYLLFPWTHMKIIWGWKTALIMNIPTPNHASCLFKTHSNQTLEITIRLSWQNLERANSHLVWNELAGMNNFFTFYKLKLFFNFMEIDTSLAFPFIGQGRLH